MSNNETKKLVKGALLLTVAGLISKILSASYRIPLQNLTGDLGFYIYQQVYPLLGIILILSLYGFPSAISKMSAEMKTAGKSTSLKQFYLPIFLLLLAINGFFFILLYMNASSIAGWIGDTQLTRSYQLAAFTFLLVPFSSLLRGIFQGNYNMKPTAYSQVGEQLVRVFLIIIVAYLFFVGKIEVYQIGEAAAFASVAGAITAILILSIFLVKEKPISEQHYKIPWRYYLQTLFTLGIVAALNHMILLIIQFADVFTLVPNLMSYGLTSLDAMAAKGIFDRGQPLIQLGTVLGSSFALAFIPAISKKKLEEDPERTITYIQSGLLFSFYLAAGAVIGLIFIFPEVNVLLFKDLKGTSSLQILSIAILLSSISITVSSILQGLGYFKRTAVFILLAFLIKWFANMLFVPLWGITGSALATVLSLLILCIIVLFDLTRKFPEIKLFKGVNVIAFTKASLGMVIYLLIISLLMPYEVIDSRVLLLFYVIFIAMTGALIYLFLLLRCSAFTEKELSMLPYASILINIHRGRDSVDKQK